MTKLEQIELSVAALSKDEMKQFAVWFAELHRPTCGIGRLKKM
jgi:hypothetical protein